MNPFYSQPTQTAFDWSTLGVGSIFFFAGIVAVGTLVFLILRELVCWYWKINESLDMLDRINENSKLTNALLRSILERLEGKPVVEKQQEPRPASVVAPRIISEEKPIPKAPKIERHYFGWVPKLLSWFQGLWRRIGVKQMTIGFLTLIVLVCGGLLGWFAWMLMPLFTHR